MAAGDPAGRPGPGRLHTKLPAGRGFRPGLLRIRCSLSRAQRQIPPRPLTPDQRRQIGAPEQVEARQWDLTAAPGRPQLPTSQSFLRPRAPPAAGAHEVERGARSRPQEPRRCERRWRAWSLQRCSSPAGLGLRAGASAGSPPGASIRPQRARPWSPLPARWSPPPASPHRSSASGPGAAPTPSPGPSGRARQRRPHSPGSRSRGLARSRRW